MARAVENSVTVVVADIAGRRGDRVAHGFSWYEFVVAFAGCVLGITFLSAAWSDYFLAKMRVWERWTCAGAG